MNSEEVEAAKVRAPCDMRAVLDGISWNYTQEEETRRLDYLNELFDKVSAGQVLPLEDSGRVVLNAMQILRENSALRKRLDSMVLELIRSTMSKYSFRG